jgi:hypothetical protein
MATPTSGEALTGLVKPRRVTIKKEIRKVERNEFIAPPGMNGV